MNVLVTGSTGFLGSRVFTYLDGCVDFTPSSATRRHNDNAKSFFVGEVDSDTDWSRALVNQRVVIHTAARAHIMKDDLLGHLTEYRKVNVQGTLNLAKQATEAGVHRFIFISSIKVNGEKTPPNHCFTANDAPAPEDAYGISKLEAEQGLLRLASKTGMEVVIIRPPLVYGPGVKGNFASIVRLVEKGVPLPLGAIHNKRSLVALDNLVDLIITCIDHPAAVNQTFLAGDGEDLSTTQLLRGVGNAMGKPARLIPVPTGLLMFSAALLGKKAVAQRLLSSLQVDISKARNVLGWEPPISVKEGLRRCFVSENKC